MGTNPDPNLLRANATDFQHGKVGFNDVVAKGWEQRDTSKPRVKKIQLVTPIGETTGVPLMCHNAFFQADSVSDSAQQLPPLDPSYLRMRHSDATYTDEESKVFAMKSDGTRNFVFWSSLALVECTRR